MKIDSHMGTLTMVVECFRGMGHEPVVPIA